jgi:lipid A 3-O-deacylase
MAAFDCEEILKKAIAIAIVVMSAVTLRAQTDPLIRGGEIHSLPEVPAHEVSRSKPWEYGVLVQGGIGLQDRTNYSFFLAGGHLGKVLTTNIGKGFYQGNFEYAVEVFPLWQSYTPRIYKITCPYATPNRSNCGAPTITGGTYRGASITPIILRWNLTHGRRLMPWIQGAGGLLYTTRKYPPIASFNSLDPTQTGPNADTSVWNFTPQFGIGAHYFLKPKRSIDFSANAVHISSASLGDKNPGVNTGVQFSAGYTWWK